MYVDLIRRRFKTRFKYHVSTGKMFLPKENIELVKYLEYHKYFQKKNNL